MAKIRLQTRQKTRRPDQQRYLKLTPFYEIRSRIITSFSNIKMATEDVEVDIAQGRILAQDAIAKVSVPSTTSSAMDGYAIDSFESRHASAQKPVQFRILGSIFGNARSEKYEVNANETYYISTGAPLPENADAVVKIEETKINENQIIITRPISKGKNVVPLGQDVKNGQILIPRCRVLNGLDITLLISAGITQVNVMRVPEVGILSIGDDLRDFKDTTWRMQTSHQPVIINNLFNMLAGFLSEFGIRSTLIDICRNDIDQIIKSIESHVNHYDMILTIGGTSVGAHDYTPTALESLDQSELIFHGVKMIPIKPAGLALVQHKPVLIVPAHASSAAFTTFMFVLPVLNIISGLQFDDRKLRLSAIAEEEIENPHNLDSLALVRLKRMEDGSYHATHLGWYSNLVSNVAKANGFLIMKPKQMILKSDLVTVELLGVSQLGRIILCWNRF